jgi:hypothetical protein
VSVDLGVDFVNSVLFPLGSLLEGDLLAPVDEIGVALAVLSFQN